MSESGVPPSSITAASLWPDLSSEQGMPIFLTGTPIWSFLDPTSENGLKAQLAALIEELGRSDGAIPEGVHIDDGDGPVVVREGAIIEPGAMLMGPCYIDGGAKVLHAAYVRPHSWICANAIVGHATEVKHSVLLPGAKAPHFNYVGDSVLGPGVNLGAGCKLSNLRNDGREVIVRGLEGGAVVSGLRKFGAILGSGCQLGCNVVTNPGVILAADTHVHPNATVSGTHGRGSVIR